MLMDPISPPQRRNILYGNFNSFRISLYVLPFRLKLRMIYQDVQHVQFLLYQIDANDLIHVHALHKNLLHDGNMACKP
jgi:hypothetical protein